MRARFSALVRTDPRAHPVRVRHEMQRKVVARDTVGVLLIDGNQRVAVNCSGQL
jgi:hypothetical protein